MNDAPIPGQDAVPRRALGIRIRKVNGDFVIGHRNQALLLSDVAGFIFTALDGRRTVTDVARLVAREYAVAEGQALTDVREFLDDLADKEIVEWAESS